MVMEGDTLFLHAKPNDPEVIASISLNDCKLKGKTDSIKVLILYNSKDSTLMMGIKELEMVFRSKKLAETWKAVFLSRGVIHTELDPIDAGFDIDSLSSEMIAKIEKIRILVEKYLNIVIKNIQDLSIKTCLFLMVYKFDDFLKNELFYKICSKIKSNDLLKIDADKQKMLNNSKTIYFALKKCIMLIDTRASYLSQTDKRSGIAYVSCSNIGRPLLGEEDFVGLTDDAKLNRVSETISPAPQLNPSSKPEKS
ncbi:hypothetical protein HZS_578, partial [Henneguya salminicola]